ncbi:MAG: GTP-binding protein [Nanoarchaeota archaeon]|nr:GTP-binding protein [Nanoarchaeota archaeon]
MAGKKGANIGRKKDVQLVERKKSSLQEQIKELEDQIAKTKYNKKTQHAIGLYKAKLAQLKDKSEQRGSKGGRGDERFNVRKTGDGTAVLLGFPSVGKSTLLNKLTNAKSDIGAYEFTTLSAVPGLMKYKHAKIQIIDVPGVVYGAASGRGRGKEVLTMLRNADLILILIDAQNPAHYEALLKEIYETNIRINQDKPDVVITRKVKGGLSISSLVRLTKIDQKTIEDITRMFKITNADILFREDIDVDQFIDVLEGNRIYTKALNIITKIDLVDNIRLKEISSNIKPDVVVSAEQDKGIKELKKAIYRKLDLMRIFLKEVGKKADMEEPLIMFRGCKIKDVCEKLHKDFVDNFKFARLWGKSAKFDGQLFKNMDKGLQDCDVLELHIR